METDAILVENLTEALKQINSYLALGLAAVVSALALDLRAVHAEKPEKISVPGVFVAMTPEMAELVLLGICFVAGMLAAYSAEGAVKIAQALSHSPGLLEAACTYPSVATSPIGFRAIAGVLPFAFALLIVVRMWRRLRAIDRGGVSGLIVSIGFFVVPYGALVLSLTKLP